MTDSIFRSKQICANTWHITGDGSSSYLLVGDQCGLVIDTGFALENIQQYAQSLTDKPVRYAANTHGHFDHTGGNGWFERAYMSAKALEIAKTPYPSKTNLPYPLTYEVTVVGDGDRIELGGRSLEVFEIPTHAPSSVAYLDRKARIMFTGDEVGYGVMLYWMDRDEPQPTIEQHAIHMEKLLKNRKEFDFVCSGHDPVMANASMVEDHLEHDRLILSGQLVGEQFEMSPDGPADFVMRQIEYKRKSTYKGNFLGYDVRYIFNKKEK